MSEYIKKEDLFNKTIKRNSIWNGTTNAEGKGLEEIVNDLPSYSFPDSAKTDTAKPEEGAELIDRRQIKWYGCDHEGHIKGINCDTADCSKCFFATVEHDEVMSLPVYRIPDSAENKGEWIPVSERLPKDDTDVVILTELGTVKSCHYFEGFNNYPGCTRDYIFDDVIAWLPIPEPYVEDRSKIRTSGAKFLEEVGGEIGSSCEKFIRQMTGNEGGRGVKG